MTSELLSITLDPLAPYHVVPDFCVDAPGLRGGFDRHFDKPEKQGPDHEVWNYWYVPDSYAYLRTTPDKVIAPQMVDRFVARLSRFTKRWLGMESVTRPFLSLYLEGCKQTLHNDSSNGAFGYVYSLTRWDERRFEGGETLIFRESDYWASGRFRQAAAGVAFYDKVPARFNQLLVFDDRLIHGVPEVRGTCDPREGRLVLHGHIQCDGVSVDGPLEQSLGQGELGALGEVLASTQNAVDAEQGRYHGFATIALDVAAEGTVTSVRPLVQRVLGRAGPEAEVSHLSDLCSNLAKLRFAPQAAPSRIAVPQFFV